TATEDAIAHNDQRRAFGEPGKLPEAVVEHTTAIRLRADSAMSHVYLSLALKTQGGLDEAIAAYKTAISLDPTFFAPHSSLGHPATEQSGDRLVPRPCRAARGMLTGAKDDEPGGTQVP
ncbi:MAG: tetratricopeptide repeat protein, partial [Candidatus Sericytochromatia bacterium]|nr:tetratricopeptide repeat protein [Candidatus Sericytochromatia bacterium]